MPLPTPDDGTANRPWTTRPAAIGQPWMDSIDRPSTASQMPCTCNLKATDSRINTPSLSAVHTTLCGIK